MTNKKSPEPGGQGLRVNESRGSESKRKGITKSHESDARSKKNPANPNGSPTSKEIEPRQISKGIYVIDIWRFEPKVNARNAQLAGVSRDEFLKLINSLGYFKRYRADGTFQYVKEKANIIEAVEISMIRDEITAIVQSQQAINIDFAGLEFKATSELQMEKFLNSSPSLFNDAILGHLPNHIKRLLHDSKKEMFFPFLNCVVKVTSSEFVTMDYSELKGVCIWKDHIINRTFEHADDNPSQFGEFIVNVSNGESDRLTAFRSAIGYLLHNFSDPTTARAVIAYDQEITNTNEPAGGTGKGLFSQGIGQLRNTAVIDGKKIDDRNQFSYQMVTERTQVISFDDVRANFNFLMLNSNLTTGWQIEHKNKQPFRFAPNDNPKTYITSNTILKAEGITAKRRMFIIEFSPYYSNIARQNHEPIIQTHGAMFFTEEWSREEWHRFFKFMFGCCVYYLREGLKFYELRGVDQNKLVQTTSDDFAEWIIEQKIEQGKEFDLSEFFTSFKSLYYGDDSEFKQRTFTNWLKSYTLSKNMNLKIRNSNGRRLAKTVNK
jgi:hypothetical protein